MSRYTNWSWPDHTLNRLTMLNGSNILTGVKSKNHPSRTVQDYCLFNDRFHRAVAMATGVVVIGPTQLFPKRRLGN